MPGCLSVRILGDLYEKVTVTVAVVKPDKIVTEETVITMETVGTVVKWVTLVSVLTVVILANVVRPTGQYLPLHKFKSNSW